MKISKNFSLSEFECNCGCTMPDFVKKNIETLAEDLQVLRDTIDKPIKITNAFRCKDHNQKVGGVKSSQHILGRAADLQVDGMEPKEVADNVEALMKSELIKKGGVGRYSTFTHVDGRGYDARWTKK
jgi:uncharacterized protein YcbK (DUF882 family)|tara:strand:+ start:1280 stop:1660 length:381 start_codon:yes stop_codon:yes gene_type:complete